MSIEPVEHLWRAARVAYSRHLAARLFRLWRYLSAEPPAHSAADILLLPLTGLTLTLWVLGTVPGAVDAVTAACTSACMP